MGVTQRPPRPPPLFPLFFRVSTLIGSSWTVSRKSRSAECINKWDHPSKLFSLHFLWAQYGYTQVFHALKTTNEHSQEPYCHTVTFPAGLGPPQVLIKVAVSKTGEVFQEKKNIFFLLNPFCKSAWQKNWTHNKCSFYQQTDEWMYEWMTRKYK